MKATKTTADNLMIDSLFKDIPTFTPYDAAVRAYEDADEVSATLRQMVWGKDALVRQDLKRGLQRGAHPNARPEPRLFQGKWFCFTPEYQSWTWDYSREITIGPNLWGPITCPGEPLADPRS